MGIPFRDADNPTALLRNQSGQGIVEYILVLAIVVSMVIGGIYQLNTGFKKWAENYFGSYLACLLETGELPIISGGGSGGGGMCDSLYQAFTFEKGRPPKPVEPGTKTATPRSGRGGGDSPGAGSGGREGRYSPSGRGGGSSGPGGTSFGRFASKSGANADSKAKDRTPANIVDTGDTSTKGSPSQFSSQNRKLDTRTRSRLNTSSVMEENKPDKVKTKITSTLKNGGSNPNAKKKLLLNGKAFAKKVAPPEESEWAFADFIRVLIIAAIVIALVMFLGGQAMQIGKSME